MNQPEQKFNTKIIVFCPGCDVGNHIQLYIPTKKLVKHLYSKSADSQVQYSIFHTNEAKALGVDTKEYCGMVCLFKKKDGDWLKSKPMISNLAKKLVEQFGGEMENASFWN